MALDALIAVIDQLRERMDAHAPALRQNEMMTRYALIDPLLSALGWDTSDPSEVRPEYKTGKRWADYALLKADGTPAVFVEAKSLGKDLSDHDVLWQGITYCVQEGTRYFAVTNGREWDLYDVSREGVIEEKRVGDFDISGPLSVADFRALGLLWKPPLDEAGPSLPDVITPQPEQPGSGVPSVKTDAPSPTRPGSCVPLDEFEAKIKTPPPKRLFLPDGQQRNLRYWKDLLVEIALYLVNTGKLSSRGCPISRWEGSGRYVVHNQPVHASGAHFQGPYDLGHDIHLEASVVAWEAHNYALTLIDHCGEDPSRYGVESV